ncbi:MAG TPA: amino acid--tRNA ligase-related protein, partial [Methyloversatilis sp.]
MGLNAEQLTEVARITLAAGSLREAVNGVREALPGIRASTVDAFDMRGETPALRIGDRDLFLMHSDGHKPVILTDYPKEIKAFYMRQNDDEKTVRAMDILFPGIGEIVGGSQREER